MEDKLIDFWFYAIAAIDHSGKTAAKFYIAKDYSSVYRTDLAKPKLIFGSAQSMIRQKDVYYEEQRNFVSEEDNKKGIVGMDSPIIHDERLVVVSITPGAPKIGKTAHITARIAGDIPYKIQASSNNPKVISVNKDGSLQILKSGSAVISGNVINVIINDAKKSFSIKQIISAP